MVAVELLDPGQAPGMKAFLTDRCRFTLTDLHDQWVGLEPAEGWGTQAKYFEAHRLCDAQTQLRQEVWEPLDRCRAWDEGLSDERRRILHAEAVRYASGGDIAGVLRGLQAAIVGAGNDVTDVLAVAMPNLFEAFPDGSLWLVSTEEELVTRLTFLRIQHAAKTTPDFRTDPAEFVGVRALTGHSLTQGVDFSDLLSAMLLAFSPGAIGYAFPWPPHTFVFLFGSSLELRVPEPGSLVSLYEPATHSRGDRDIWTDPLFWKSEFNPGDLEALLGWWVTRLNIVYAFAADPTRFEVNGAHDVSRQFAWFLTFERMVLDAICVLTAVQSPWATREQSAFDLLDKAEALLGVGLRGSGDGFKRLLRRQEGIALLDRSWDCMPVRLRPRFRAHSRHLYKETYAHVHEQALGSRRTSGAVQVWDEARGLLVASALESYVPNIARAIRNSAHGFFEQLTGPERHLLATHTGALPRSFGDLVALIFFGLMADPARLVEGTWWS